MQGKRAVQRRLQSNFGSEKEVLVHNIQFKVDLNGKQGTMNKV